MVCRGCAGPFLVKRIQAYFKSRDTKINVKFIDPSYMIRRCARPRARRARPLDGSREGCVSADYSAPARVVLRPDTCLGLQGGLCPGLTGLSFC